MLVLHADKKTNLNTTSYFFFIKKNYIFFNLTIIFVLKLKAKWFFYWEINYKLNVF